MTLGKHQGSEHPAERSFPRRWKGWYAQCVCRVRRIKLVAAVSRDVLRESLPHDQLMALSGALAGDGRLVLEVSVKCPTCFGSGDRVTGGNVSTDGPCELYYSPCPGCHGTKEIWVDS